MADAESGRSGLGRIGSLWLPVLAWAGLLRWLGAAPPEAFPDTPWAWIPGLDKLEHALAYGVLGFLVVRALHPGGAWRSALWAGLCGLAWGALDEWLQASSPGRHGDWGDLAADTLGAAGGGWLAFRTLLARVRS